MDLRLIPVLALLYLLSFLDRKSSLSLSTPIFNSQSMCYTSYMSSRLWIDLTSRDRRQYWQRQDRGPPGRPWPARLRVQLVPDGLLLHIRSFRGALQSASQEAAALTLAAYHHGRLGYRHDAHGHRPELPRPAGRTSVPRRCGSRVVSRGGGELVLEFLFFFAFPNFLGRSRSGCIVLFREPYPTPMLFLCCVS